jgi:hypothetical protein
MTTHNHTLGKFIVLDTVVQLQGPSSKVPLINGWACLESPARLPQKIKKPTKLTLLVIGYLGGSILWS